MNKFEKRRKRVLVTGGTGFIGSHIVLELLKNAYDILIGDNFSNSSPEILDRIEEISSRRPDFRELDFCDREATFKLFKDYPDIAFIIHLAGYKSAGESVSNPLKYYRNNLLSAKNIIEAALESKVKNFIFSSSAAVYGNPEQVPVSEAAPVKKPSSPYGNTKKIIEEILNDVCLAQAGKFKVISLRYFNAAGAHKSGLIGELPKGAPENLIPFITQTAAGVRDELKVFGNDYGTTDGTCIRDYVHVLDLASAHLKALEKLENEGGPVADFEAYNIGTGRGVSVLEAIKAFEKVSGLKLKHRIVSRRAGDPETVYADSSLAAKNLNWRARYNIEDIMKDAWAWEKFYRKIKD